MMRPPAGNGKGKPVSKARTNSPGAGEQESSLDSVQRLLAGLSRNIREVLWVASTFLVMFSVLFVSQMPPQIGLRVGEVSPINVKAPQEVIDQAATERLKSERAKTVSKAWDTDPNVLSDLTSMLTAMRDKIAQLSSGTDLSTQEIVKELRPFVLDDLPDADIIAVVATSAITLDASMSRTQTALADILSTDLKAENLDWGKQKVSEALNADDNVPSQMARFLMSFVQKNLRPNHILNQEETDKRVKEAVAAVEPVRIRRGQFIIREGDVVSDDQIAILQSLGMMGGRVRLTAIAGALLMSVLICGFLTGYVGIYHPDLVTSGKLPMLASAVIIGVLAVKAACQVSGLLAPTAAGVILASTLVDRRMGVIFGSCLTLVVGSISGFDVRFMALSLVGGLAAALTIRVDWNRSAVVRAGLVVAAANTVTFAALGLTGAIPLADVLSIRDLLFVAGNGPLSSVLALGSLPLFEILFGIITPIRLIELSNPEHPLLHRLLLEAPGTYHHSIMVGNLAEAGAWAIGADSLLARVGAYYHDVGKIRRPYFFVENQVFGLENPHDKMSPALSATVIMSHVKDGLELADEHKLPSVIRQFIAEHHGTTLASFFFMKASSENQTKDQRGPEEWDFRYEGPRPQSKETAVVMLADSIEAAVRSISKPTPARIESMVRRLIQEKLTDHQLDRSDLTLKELDTIADTFTKVLTGIFHTRIEYPDRNLGKPPEGNEGAAVER